MYDVELCQIIFQYLIKCDKVITVCKGISDLYNENFNVSCEVITNATEYADLIPISNKKSDK